MGLACLMSIVVISTEAAVSSDGPHVCCPVLPRPRSQPVRQPGREEGGESLGPTPGLRS